MKKNIFVDNYYLRLISYSISLVGCIILLQSNDMITEFLIGPPTSFFVFLWFLLYIFSKIEKIKLNIVLIIVFVLFGFYLSNYIFSNAGDLYGVIIPYIVFSTVIMYVNNFFLKK